MHISFHVWRNMDHTSLKYNFDSVLISIFTVLKYTEFLTSFLQLLLSGLDSFSFKLFLHTAFCIKQEFKCIHEIT